MNKISIINITPNNPEILSVLNELTWDKSNQSVSKMEYFDTENNCNFDIENNCNFDIENNCK